jgi:imidazolonepropionase
MNFPCTVWLNCKAATMQAGTAPPYGLIEDAALVVSGGLLQWVGPRSDLPAEVLASAMQTHDAQGALITPGLIDCHTHLVYGGNRAGEFEQRLNGASYEDIAKAGGGVASTVKATRAATELELSEQSTPRLEALLAEGVTTVEIKSGYGLAPYIQCLCKPLF